MSDTLTDGIRVRVKASWWAERSAPDAGQWAFTYTVVISNEGTAAARLMSRHWVITDATGHQEEVRGDGVVGKQPLIAPGESFEYTSWAMLKTPFGSMEGEYFLERAEGGEEGEGSTFTAKIGSFLLAQPNALH
jgi:ApaG protein